MKYKRYIFSIVLLFSFVSVFSQYSQINGQKTIGNLKHNFAHSVIALEDGGYIVIGETETDTNSMDFLVARVSVSNEIVWQKTYGGSGVDRPSEIIRDENNGFLIIGSTSSADGDITENNGLYDFWLVNINVDGELLWEKTFGGSENDFGVDIISTNTAEYYIAGNSSSIDGDISGNNGGSDFWLIKVEENGFQSWDRNYGGSENEYLKDIILLDTSIYLLGGTKSNNGDVSNNQGEKDVWFLKTDFDGEIIWENTFGGSDTEEGKVINQLNDGGFLLGAVTKSEDGDISKSFGLNDFWLLEINDLGEMLWQKSYGGSRDDVLKDVLKTDDGFLLAGNTYSYNGNIDENKGRSDLWFAKIYSNGAINWQKTYGGSGNENCSKVIKGFNSTYISANQSDSYDFDVDENIGETDIWMLELCESFLTLDNIKICEGDSLLWEGEYYSNGGDYRKKFQSACGLDSVRRLLLTEVVVPGLPIIEGPDLVTEFESYNYGTESGYGFEYFWQVTNGYYNDTVFNNIIRIVWGVAGNGEVSLVVANEGICFSDTVSLQVYVSGVGVDENYKINKLNVYPNPSSNGIFNIEIENAKKFEQIIVYDIYSNEILSKTNTGNKFSLNLSNNPKGVYFVNILSEGKVFVGKLVLY